MEKYLPSKQFARTILAALALGLVVFLVGKILNKKTVWENKSGEEAVALEQNEDFFSQDTDSDGLYDWEEALWSTNPSLKDTDGDGIDDKKFVENKRKEIDVDETYESDPNNETEVFAKQFFTTASVLNQSGSFNQETVNQFSQGVGQSISNFTLKDKYTLSDLKLSAVSADTYYGNFKTLYNSLPNKEIKELENIALLIQNPEDQVALDNVAKINLMYSKLEDGLLSMDVPYNVSGGHLFLLNNINKISQVILESRNIDYDPLKVTTYLSKYDEYSNNIESALGTLASYFSQNGIIN
ncbi:MAG: hypothetical protein QG654_209 [Patescibacteria group bacterium]|jgi:hypothetical protein|nr:hypothetical protein [Patescibacteria group bacterium]